LTDCWHWHTMNKTENVWEWDIYYSSILWDRVDCKFAHGRVKWSLQRNIIPRQLSLIISASIKTQYERSCYCFYFYFSFVVFHLNCYCYYAVLPVDKFKCINNKRRKKINNENTGWSKFVEVNAWVHPPGNG